MTKKEEKKGLENTRVETFGKKGKIEKKMEKIQLKEGNKQKNNRCKKKDKELSEKKKRGN